MNKMPLISERTTLPIAQPVEVRLKSSTKDQAIKAMMADNIETG